MSDRGKTWELSDWLLMVIAAVFVAVFYLVIWRQWSPGLLIPIWLASLGVMVFMGPINGWWGWRRR